MLLVVFNRKHDGNAVSASPAVPLTAKSALCGLKVWRVAQKHVTPLCAADSTGWLCKCEMFMKLNLCSLLYTLLCFSPVHPRFGRHA